MSSKKKETSAIHSRISSVAAAFVQPVLNKESSHTDDETDSHTDEQPMGNTDMQNDRSIESQDDGNTESQKDENTAAQTDKSSNIEPYRSSGIQESENMYPQIDRLTEAQAGKNTDSHPSVNTEDTSGQMDEKSLIRIDDHAYGNTDVQDVQTDEIDVIPEVRTDSHTDNQVSESTDAQPSENLDGDTPDSAAVESYVGSDVRADNRMNVEQLIHLDGRMRGNVEGHVGGQKMNTSANANPTTQNERRTTKMTIVLDADVAWALNVYIADLRRNAIRNRTTPITKSDWIQELIIKELRAKGVIE